jgi:succinate dehydrogenase hydrophobic anchor subunit
MLTRFLNSRVPSILSALAFVVFSLLFVHAIVGAREPAAVTTDVLRELMLWGVLALIAMLAFCLCLMKVTRYRRGLPDKRNHLR